MIQFINAYRLFCLLPDIERIQQTEKLAELQAKHAMLNQKERMLDAELVAEKNIMQHIRSATPLKIDGTNANEDRAKQAIQEAVAELKAYYLKCDNNGEGIRKIIAL